MTHVRDIQGTFAAEGIKTQYTNSAANRLGIEDRPAHNWYRFVLSFPPHLVRDYLARFQIPPRTHSIGPVLRHGDRPGRMQETGNR